MKTKFLLIAVLIFFISCSGDDESSNENQAEVILGTWKCVGYEFDGSGSTPPLSEYANTTCGYWATENSTEGGMSIYQSFDGNCIESGSPETTPYSVDGGYLIYQTLDEGAVSWKIEELDNNSLKILNNGEHLIYNK